MKIVPIASPFQLYPYVINAPSFLRDLSLNYLSGRTVFFIFWGDLSPQQVLYLGYPIVRT